MTPPTIEERLLARVRDELKWDGPLKFKRTGYGWRVTSEDIILRCSWSATVMVNIPRWQIEEGVAYPLQD